MSLPGGCHPSVWTLGSSKTDHKQEHYTAFSMRLPKTGCQCQLLA
ncbi:hypothetical protein [Wolbachia endosymbiont of Madathamugadia hiepei]